MVTAFAILAMFLDAMASPNTYTCQWVGRWVRQWFIVSDLEIVIASPRVASLLLRWRMYPEIQFWDICITGPEGGGALPILGQSRNLDTWKSFGCSGGRMVEISGIPFKQNMWETYEMRSRQTTRRSNAHIWGDLLWIWRRGSRRSCGV